MDPLDLVGRTLETGREVTQRSQERLESLVGQLQRLSEDQLDQVAALVGELRDRSLLSGEQVAGFVDRRVRAQLAALGIATQADLARVEAKVDRLGKSGGGARGDTKRAKDSARAKSAKGGTSGKGTGSSSASTAGSGAKQSGGKDSKSSKGAKGAKGRAAGSSAPRG
jgi:hypothetical protein